MKKIIAVAAALQLFVTASKGASITAQANDSNGFSNSSGAELAVGNLVRVGTFNLTDEQISASSDITNPTNRDFLNANFVEFGSLRIGVGFPFAGHFQGPLMDRPNSDTLGFKDRQVYLWVFASTDLTSVTQSVNTAFEHGIFYFSAALNDEWRFHATGEIPNTSTIDIANLTDLATSSTLLPGAHVVVGTFPKGTSSKTNAPNFGLAIPEPSSAGLLTLGGASLLTRRRKSK